MGVLFRIHGADFCPTVQCDECGEVIEKEDQGNVVWGLPLNHGDRDLVPVCAFVHHNKIRNFRGQGCHNAWEAKNPVPDGAARWGWIHLNEFLANLNHNLTFERGE